MRLDDYDNNIDVEDQRGRGGGFSLGGGGGGGFPLGMILSLVGSRFGILGILVVVGASFLFGGLPRQLAGPVGETPSQQVGQPGGETLAQACDVNAFSHESCNALSSLNKTWKPLLAQENIAFRAPKLVFYSSQGQSGCGAAQSAMGPFYCPADQGIYIDTSFYDQLDRELGAKGDFARYYVMAHEYGHHVQYLTGLADQIRSAQQQDPSRANALQVGMELQADCYAGVWAGRHKDLIEPGDMEEGLTAASAIGDDTLMKNAGRSVNPESFTHGSSADRMKWLKTGLETGNEDACDTFS